MSPRLISFLMLVLICVCEVKHVESGSCGFKNLDKYDDMAHLSNSALRNLANMNSVTRLKETFQHFNIERVVGTPGHRAVREYIKSTMAELGWAVEEDRFEAHTPIGQKQFVNVVASSSPGAQARLVLACHYDSKQFDFEFIGATDSAVPCAIILDVAKTLSDWLRAVKNISLDVVFFDGEEAFKEWTETDSIYGARHLARVWRSQAMASRGREVPCTRLDSIRALVLLDLIGAKGLQLHNLYSENAFSTTLFDQMRVLETRLRSMGRLRPDVAPIFSNYKFNDGHQLEDDHLPFKNAGVNIVHLIALPFPKVWHTRHDNAQALHWDTIENMNTITRAFIASYFHIAP